MGTVRSFTLFSLLLDVWMLSSLKKKSKASYPNEMEFIKKKQRKWIGKISRAMKILDLTVNVNFECTTGPCILNL